MDVPLSKDDVVGSPHLDLVTVLGVEEHLVPRLHVPDVGTHGDDRRPRQPFADLGGRRDQDPSAAAALSLGITQLHENAVVEHLDGKSVVVVEGAVLGVHGAQRYRYGAAMEPMIESSRLPLDSETELAVDTISPEAPTGTFVVCHPHPLHGGSRHDRVVASMVAGALDARMRVVRFDFRGAGASTGTHGGGKSAIDDLSAVMEALGPSEPVVLGGYSFGADVALSIVDERVERWVCVAPVLQVFESWASDVDERPKTLLAATHDQFRGAGELRTVVERWSDTTVIEVTGTDHFFAGAQAAIRSHVAAALVG